MKIYNAQDCYSKPIDEIKDLTKGKTLMLENEQKLFVHLMKENTPSKILELGTHIGGTTAVILATMEELNLNAKLYSVDLYAAEENMRNTIDESVSKKYPNWNQDNWLIYCDHVIAEVIEDIKGDIDFCIIDTSHMLPGEVLDFITILPFLQDGAIVVLHDTRLATAGVARIANATNILFSSVVASEKFLIQDEHNQIQNISAFRVDSDTRKYIENIMLALSLPWGYPVMEKHQLAYEKIVKKYYSKSYHLFCDCYKYGSTVGMQSIVNINYTKLKNILIENIVSLYEEKQEKIVFWGCGDVLSTFFDSKSWWGQFPQLFIDQLYQNSMLENFIFIDANSNTKLFQGQEVHKPEYIQTLGDEFSSVIITPFDSTIQQAIESNLLQMNIPKNKIVFMNKLLAQENLNKIVFWGCGESLISFFSNHKPWTCNHKLSNRIKSEYSAINNSFEFIDSDESMDLFSGKKVAKPELLKTLGDLLSGVIITPSNDSIKSEIRNEIIKMGIPEDKIFYIDEFIMGDDGILNNLSGVF